MVAPPMNRPGLVALPAGLIVRSREAWFIGVFFRPHRLRKVYHLSEDVSSMPWPALPAVPSRCVSTAGN